MGKTHSRARKPLLFYILSKINYMSNFLYKFACYLMCNFFKIIFWFENIILFYDLCRNGPWRRVPPNLFN